MVRSISEWWHRVGFKDTFVMILASCFFYLAAQNASVSDTGRGGAGRRGAAKARSPETRPTTPQAVPGSTSRRAPIQRPSRFPRTTSTTSPSSSGRFQTPGRARLPTGSGTDSGPAAPEPASGVRQPQLHPARGGGLLRGGSAVQRGRRLRAALRRRRPGAEPEPRAVPGRRQGQPRTYALLPARPRAFRSR